MQDNQNGPFRTSGINQQQAYNHIGNRNAVWNERGELIGWISDQRCYEQDEKSKMLPNRWAGSALDDKIIITSAHKINTSIFEEVEVVL